LADFNVGMPREPRHHLDEAARRHAAAPLDKLVLTDAAPIGLAAEVVEASCFPALVVEVLRQIPDCLERERRNAVGLLGYPVEQSVNASVVFWIATLRRKIVVALARRIMLIGHRSTLETARALNGRGHFFVSVANRCSLFVYPNRQTLSREALRVMPSVTGCGFGKKSFRTET